MEDNKIFNSEEVKLSAPWITYFHEIEELFRYDPEVRTQMDKKTNTIYIYVENNARKADALTQLIAPETEFGNVKVTVKVIPSNTFGNNMVSLYQDAFEGNPVLSTIIPIQAPVWGEVDYIVFQNKVVQFYNDQMDDPHGNLSTLYQEMAKHVLKQGQGVFFCTDTGDENIGKPLGEWP